MTPALLTVDLPVCPTCRRVGKLPSAQFAGKDLCTGPYNEPHKKVRMQTVRFQEVAASKAEAS
jgi:hypothetical protein